MNNDSNFPIQIPGEMLLRLETLSRLTGRATHELVLEALSYYLDGKKPGGSDRPNLPIESDEDIDDEPDEILWDFIEPEDREVSQQQNSAFLDGDSSDF